MVIQGLGRLHLVNLSFEAIVGILAQEREKKQKVIVNAEMGVDFRSTRQLRHHMTHGLNYAEFKDFIKTTIIDEKYGLLENLLLDLGERAFKKFDDLQELRLHVAKPDILEDCSSVAAEMYFTR